MQTYKERIMVETCFTNLSPCPAPLYQQNASSLISLLTDLFESYYLTILVGKTLFNNYD